MRLFTHFVRVYESSISLSRKALFQGYIVSGIRHFILNLLVVGLVVISIIRFSLLIDLTSCRPPVAILLI